MFGCVKPLNEQREYFIYLPLRCGADFQIIRPNGFAELEAKYAFETDDGAVIYIENIGIRFGPKPLLDRIAKGEIVDPSQIYFRSVPRFETGAANYRCL